MLVLRLLLVVFFSSITCKYMTQHELKIVNMNGN